MIALCCKYFFKVWDNHMICGKCITVLSNVLQYALSLLVYMGLIKKHMESKLITLTLLQIYVSIVN